MSNRELRPRTDRDWGRGNWAVQSFCLERGTFKASIGPPKGHRDMIYWSSKEHHAGLSSHSSHTTHNPEESHSYSWMNSLPRTAEKHRGKPQPQGPWGLTPEGLLNLSLELGPSPFLLRRSFYTTALIQHALVGGEWELMTHESSSVDDCLGLSLPHPV